MRRINRILNSAQSSSIWSEYTALLKKTRDPKSVSPSRSKLNWRNSIQDYVNTKDFKNEFWVSFPSFRGYDQNDAHEFWTSLLDLMSKELNRIKTKPKYSEIKVSSKDSIENQALKWFDYYQKIEDSHITDYFQGQTVTEIKWSRCNTSSYSFDNSMFLHLDISKKARLTMDELIQNMSESETIDDFKCSSWKKKTSHTKTFYMYKAPKILIVHLKRFEYGYYQAKKVNTIVELDNNLDLACKNSTTARYSLVSIVHHRGSMNSGHYHWEIKDSDASTSGSTKWYSFNDEYVTSTQVDAWTKTWYIMFYELVETAR